MSAIEVLRQLYEDGLYDDLEILASLLLTVDRNCDDVLMPSHRYQALVWYGDVLRESRQFKKAELMYEQALQLKRSVVRKRQHEDITPHAEVQYRIYQCLLGRKEIRLATSTLENIPLKQRTPKMNMALGRLYQSQGNDRGAIACYKDVLKVNPYAIAAITSLLELNMKAADVSSMVTSKGLHVTMEWLPAFVAACGDLHSKNTSKALEAFQSLDTSLQLKESFDVSLMLAKLHYFQGESNKALGAFERAVKADKYQVRGMDLYASLLMREKRSKELEQLSNHLLSLSDSMPETWVALGYLCYNRGKFPRARHMCDKALDMNPKHVNAVILKAEILFAIGGFQSAASTYSEAQIIAPHRFEPYRGQVTCYLSQNRFSDAQTAATNAIRQLGQSPRTLTLKAEALAKNNQIEKARSYLERVLAHDPGYLPAIYDLAEILDQTRNYQGGVQLLSEKLQLVGSTLRLHQMYAEFLHKTNEPEQALFHYGIALNLDPGNAQVKKGIQLVEQSVGGEQSYDMEMDDDRESEANNDDSDGDGVWSDEF
ncbi:anaphase-promoting complex subunit 7 [Galendromus occidentalis]|uniref:Anaphase-promoting complex subunit 7 n=1 Tax=Galendromus occidentalis TaxID=34638 RepID=A0AAJ6QQJ1_9ACAR|nr:anaphase-promoting complex subunit 7 [Galendromus occidentalis]